ncbi:MAG: hypothetical protein ACR2PF_01750 [Rhizobiaceae bacterium]
MDEFQLNQEPPLRHDGNVRRIVSRLTEYIDLENAAIKENADFDFALSSERKSRLLFEFNRANMTFDPTDLAHETVGLLRRLNDSLNENEQRIQAHLLAVKEVSGILVDLMRDEENDGTYGDNPKGV